MSLGRPSTGYGRLGVAPRGPRVGAFTPKRRSVFSRVASQGSFLRHLDWALIAAVLALCAVGIVLVWSATKPTLAQEGAKVVAARAKVAAEQNGADRGLIVLAGWVGVLALAADGIDQADRLRTLLRRIVMLATAMAALGAIEFCTGVDLTKYIVLPGLSVHQQVTDLVSRNGLVRVTATTGQPLEFNAVLAMSLPIALHQARFAPAALRVRRWLQVALITAAVPMTGSRSAFFGLAVICIVLFPTWHRRDRLRACLAGLAAPALAWLVKPSLVSNFTALFGQLGADRSSLSRADAYSEAVPYIAAHPWLGQGFQTFFPQTYFFVDNQYVTSLLETGVLGLLALVVCFATGWFTARSARAAAADARTRDLGQCLAASIAVGAVCFASFDALSFSIAAGLFFLLLGCVGAAWRLGRTQQLAGNQAESCRL